MSDLRTERSFCRSDWRESRLRPRFDAQRVGRAGERLQECAAETGRGPRPSGGRYRSPYLPPVLVDTPQVRQRFYLFAAAFRRGPAALRVPRDRVDWENLT